jgi:hypothetical protein
VDIDAPRKIPPDTFSLMPRPFRPHVGVKRTPGLENIEELVKQGKLRSAMDGVLAALDHDPENEQALRLAMIIFGAVPRTQQVNADEALGPNYWRDTRLDRIFAVCSRCRSKSWVPHECLLEYAMVVARNPVGLQCQECGYVVCRVCLEELSGKSQNSVVACPNCRKSALGKPVYPTGRNSLQLERFGRPVQLVYIMREGPIPPTVQEVNKLLYQFSPDPLSDDHELIFVPVEPWTDNIQQIGTFKLYGLMNKFDLDSQLFEIGAAIVQDENGLRAGIFRASAYLPGQQFEIRLSNLEKELNGQPASTARSLKQLVLEQLQRVSAQHRGSPEYDPSARWWVKLIAPKILEVTSDLLLQTVRQANETMKLAFKAVQFEDLVAMASSVPAVDPATARTYFPNGYFAFMQSTGFLDKAAANDFVHWIVCTDQERFSIHLDALPLDRSAIPIAARDLLTEAERRSIGL